MSRTKSSARALAFLLAALLPGCVRETRDPSPCAVQYRSLRSLFDSLPADFRDPGLDIERVARLVEEGRESAEAFLRECGGVPWRPDVEYLLATFLLMSFERAVHGGARGLELADRALELARSARAAAPSGSRPWADAQALVSNLLGKRAAHQPNEAARAHDLEAMREGNRRLLEAYPDWPDPESVHLRIADSYLAQGEFRKARAHLEGVMGSDLVLGEKVSLHDRLFDALTGCGDLEAMEDLVHRWLVEYPDRLERKDLLPGERRAMEDWLDVADFWLGHVQLALGDSAGARAAFLQHISRLEEKEVALNAQGESLSDPARIFRDLRSRDLLRFIDQKLGKKPDLDFDFGALWCTPQKVTLASAQGKVLAALFRNPGHARSAPFLKGLDAIWRRERARGLEALVAGHLVGDVPTDRQVERMRKDLQDLQVGIPAGYDPHQPDPKIIRALTFVVSPSFLVFDREGRIAWYLPDPRGIDVGLAERVLLRILGTAP